MALRPLESQSYHELIRLLGLLYARNALSKTRTISFQSASTPVVLYCPFSGFGLVSLPLGKGQGFSHPESFLCALDLRLEVPDRRTFLGSGQASFFRPGALE